MDLWIRSQDNRILIKCESININYNVTTQIIGNYHYCGLNSIYEEDENYFILGDYDTEERALEVLDEIQNILKPEIITDLEKKTEYLGDGTFQDILIPKETFVSIEQLSTYVYEMPKE